MNYVLRNLSEIKMFQTGRDECKILKDLISLEKIKSHHENIKKKIFWEVIFHKLISTKMETLKE